VSFFSKFHKFLRPLTTKIGSQIIVVLWCIVLMEQTQDNGNQTGASGGIWAIFFGAANITFEAK
jgi:hypothetical protein